MTPQTHYRWFGFFAASLLVHAAVLAGVKLSSGAESDASVTIRVMLAPAVKGSAAEKPAPRTWYPASATRDRDLLARTFVPPPKTSAVTAGSVAPSVKKTVVAVNGPLPGAPAPKSPAAENAEPVPESTSYSEFRSDQGLDRFDSAVENGGKRAAVASAGREEEARTAAGANRVESTTVAATPAVSSAEAAKSSGAAERDNRALLSLLHRAIDRGKRYPSLARRQRREGTATVGFRLSPSGEMDAIDIDRSSGFGALDTAAITAVSSIAPFAPARTLLSEATRFTVDVTFRLN